MQILGTTLAQVTQTFLHPGYISAYPRTYGGHNMPGGDPKLLVDVGDALQLQPGAATLLPDPSPMGVMLGAVPEIWTVSLASAGTLFAGLIVLSLWRRGSDWARPTAVTLFGGLFLLASWWTGGGIRAAEAGVRRVASKPPPARYAHPRRATQTILYGLIADALVNHPRRARRLSSVRAEVAFPTRNPTQGMIMARRYFTHDGWRRPFKFRRYGNDYAVTSAGADGRFGTKDDLRIKVSRATNSSWDGTRVAYYLKRSGANLHVFFHRFPGRHFKYHNRSKARRLTGRRLFDVMSPAKLYRWQARGKTTPPARYRQLARGKRTAPLVLMVYRLPT